MNGSHLVYSSDGGRVRPPTTAGRPNGRAARSGPPGPAIPQAPDDGWVRLWRLKGGRGGKTATVITGVPGTEAEIAALAVELRRFAGAGGAVRERAIELQGDHRERLQKKLTNLGYRSKLAGG